MQEKEETQLATNAQASAKALVDLIAANETEIEEAISHAFETAQQKTEETGIEQTVKFSITHKITLNMSSNKQTDTISWSVPHKAELTQTMKDPKQKEMAF